MANVTQGPQGSAANAQKWVDNADGSFSQQVALSSGSITIGSVDDGGGSLTVDDGGTSISIDDNSSSISVDDGGGTVSVDDGGGSITVDGTVALSSVPASDRTTDNIGCVLTTDAIMNDTTVLTPKFASVSRATNADGAAVVAKVTSKKIRVLSCALVFAGASGVKWQSATSDSTGAGVDTDLSAVMSFAANGGYVLPFCPTGWFETASGEGLKLNSNSTNQVSGHLTYIEV